MTGKRLLIHTIFLFLLPLIETILAEIDVLLADGRVSILGDDSINSVDITFASLSALWLQPPEYGLEKADMVRIDRERASAAMRADIARWTDTYPNASGFVSRLYEQERQN